MKRKDVSMVYVILGILGWLLFLQMKKIGLLETAVKTLNEELAKTQYQLKLLKNKLSENSHRENINSEGITAQPELHKNPPANVIIEPIVSNTAAATASISNQESFELDLPELTAKPATQPKVSSHTSPQTAPSKTVTPPIPREPGLIDKAFGAVRRFFTEGNPIVRIGMVVMFFGVSFLVKYASSEGLFPIEFRLTGVIVVAIALLVIGWKTRLRPGAYGLVLQGGGIAVIYLTLFAAAKIYGLIPLTIAFGLLFLVVILGVLLSLLQNAQVLAILATAGGFLAPILTSSGEGSHVGLFSFYLILNLGILAIALHKSWRLLNWVGFMFTFVITVAWGVLKYEPMFYASTQPFLIAFFALYLSVAILFSFKQPTNLKGMVDGSLVFGLPLVAFGLQTTLLIHTQYGLAISAVILAAIYLVLSAGLARKHLQSHRVLIESFLALGISFATLAIPLALDASWTSVTWALEATGLVWVGLRQERLRPRFVGYLLHCAAAISLVLVDGLDTGLKPIISGDFLGLTLLALSSFIIAYLLFYFNSKLRDLEKLIAPLAIAFGVIWWFVAGFNEINAHVMEAHIFTVIILFSALSAIAAMLVGKKLEWLLLSNSVFALLPFMLIIFGLVFAIDQNDTHPTQGFNLLAIALFFIVQYRFLFNQEIKGQSPKLLSLYHVFTAWGLFALIFWEVSWQKHNLNLQGTAGLMIWFAAVAIPVITLIGAGQKRFWPFVTFERDYKNWIPAPLFILIACWFFAVCHKTTASTEHYLPLLNALDLAQFAVILIFSYATKHQFMNAVSFISTTVRVAFLGIMLFVWLNIVTVRAMSHYQQIPYDFELLWDATQIQMALSILWSLCALFVMNLSRRIQRRELWMIGAGLLGLVVLKLATKDLSGSGTLAGIISFMVVGALMLLIGFLSPIPAKKSTQDTDLIIDNPTTNESVNDAGLDKRNPINE